MSAKRCPQPENHPAGLEEHDLIVGLQGTAPTESLVERSGPRQVLYTQGNKADPLFHARTLSPGAGRLQPPHGWPGRRYPPYDEPVKGDIEELLRAGQEATAGGDWESARAAFAAATEIEGVPEGWSGLSYALWWLGQTDASIRGGRGADALQRKR
jgi:hypothetical protein